MLPDQLIQKPQCVSSSAPLTRRDHPTGNFRMPKAFQANHSDPDFLDLCTFVLKTFEFRMDSKIVCKPINLGDKSSSESLKATQTPSSLTGTDTFALSPPLRTSCLLLEGSLIYAKVPTYTHSKNLTLHFQHGPKAITVSLWHLIHFPNESRDDAWGKSRVVTGRASCLEEETRAAA